MTPAAIIMIVVIVVAMDAIIITALFSSLRSSMWGPLASAYPGLPTAPDGIRREFQSIKIGLFNLGWSVHLAVDDHCLHIEPTRYLRWFRLTKISIPWEEIRFKSRSRFGLGVTIQVRQTTLCGPEWAFGLAEPQQEAGL